MKKFIIITIVSIFLSGCMTIQEGPMIPEIPAEFIDEEYNELFIPGR